MRKYIKASIFGKPLEIIEDKENEMECIVKCPNCGKSVVYGTEMRMISGFSGCDNKLNNGKICFHDLAERVLDAKKNNYDKYCNGNFYLIEEVENNEEE